MKFVILALVSLTNAVKLNQVPTKSLPSRVNFNMLAQIKQDGEDAGLEDMYSSLDLNEDGKVTLEDLHMLLNQLADEYDASEEERQAMLDMGEQQFNLADTDGDGTISFEEFVTIMDAE